MLESLPATGSKMPVFHDEFFTDRPLFSTVDEVVEHVNKTPDVGVFSAHATVEPPRLWVNLNHPDGQVIEIYSVDLTPENLPSTVPGRDLRNLFPLTDPVEADLETLGWAITYDFKGTPAGIIEGPAITFPSRRIRATDPCYTADVWCSGVLEGYTVDSDFTPRAHLGNTYFGQRVTHISIWDTKRKYTPEAATEKSTVRVGVDSGQCGFADADLWEAINGVTLDEDFYNSVQTCDYRGERDMSGEVEAAVQRLREENASLSSLIHLMKFERYASFLDISSLINDPEMPIFYRYGPMDSAYLLATDVEGDLNGHCAFSSSGLGDGGYTCRVARDEQGEIYGAIITFMGDDDEEDDDVEDDE